MKAFGLAVVTTACVVVLGGPVASAIAHHPSTYRVPARLGTFTSTAAGPAYAATAVRKRGLVYAIPGSASSFPFVVQLSKRGTRVTRLIQGFKGSCQSGSGWPELSDRTASLAVSRTGRFSTRPQTRLYDLGDSLASETLLVTGKVTGRRMTTTQTEDVSITNKDSGAVVDTCSYKASSTLTSSLGRVYGGATSQHGPVVLQLSQDGRSIKNLGVFASGDCTAVDGTANGSFSWASGLLNTPLTGGQFDRHLDLPDGTDNFLTAATGFVRRASAAGTLDLTLKLSELNGIPTNACVTGPLTWTARSG